MAETEPEAETEAEIEAEMVTAASWVDERNADTNRLAAYISLLPHLSEFDDADARDSILRWIGFLIEHDLAGSLDADGGA